MLFSSAGDEEEGQAQPPTYGHQALTSDAAQVENPHRVHDGLGIWSAIARL